SRASGVQSALAVALADLPGVRVTLRGEGASGIVRDDFFDWPAEIRRIAGTAARPAAIVVVLGINDNQDISAGGRALERRGAEWEAAYRARIAAMVMDAS